MTDDTAVRRPPAGAEDEFDKIPSDFPRTARHAALPGSQPKILVSEYKGHFYSLGCSPPEVYERWEICEDLAAQLSEKSAISKQGKRSDMSEVDILDHYLVRLIALRWTSVAEARWVIRRVAAMLDWPIPRAAN